MENASKALLMAGGVLLVILIISLFLFAWGRFSDFYSNEDELADIENVTKFNLQFTNYERNDVYGYELISLANKVADYNFRRSNLADAKNDQKYGPIEMEFTMTEEQAKSLQFSKTIPNGAGEDTVISQKDRLFNRTRYIQSETSNQIIGQIFDTATKIEDVYGGSNYATKLAKSINSLILSKTQLEYNSNSRNMSEAQSKATALETYNKLASDKIDYEMTDSSINFAYKTMINKLTTEARIMKYYEYYQFKRGIFECTGITYYGEDASDTQNDGRVKSISFKFTGKIE